MEIQTDLNGFKYYDSLPEGWIPAVEDDFYKDRLLVYGLPFLVHSFHANRFEAYRTRSKDLISKIQPWMDEGMVYVLKNNLSG